MKKNTIYIIAIFIISVIIIYLFAIRKRMQFDKDKKKYLDIIDARYNGWLNWLKNNDKKWAEEIDKKAQANNISLPDQFVYDFTYDLNILRNNTFPDGTKVPVEFIFSWKNSKLTGGKYLQKDNKDQIRIGI